MEEADLLKERLQAITVKTSSVLLVVIGETCTSSTLIFIISMVVKLKAEAKIYANWSHLVAV